MEAVAADLVLLIVLIGNGIGIGHGGHGLVEGSVEHGDHGHAGHELLAGLDADDVGGVVERGEGIALLDCLHDLVGDDDGLGKLFAAVDDAVAVRGTVQQCGIIQELEKQQTEIKEKAGYWLHKLTL